MLKELLLAPSARTFYIDPDYGNDNNTGRSPGLAFASEAPLTASLLTPGTRVLYRRDRSPLRSQLTIPSSGAAGAPIFFGAYGPGTSKPRKYGSTAVSSGSWTSVTGTEYKIATALHAPNPGGASPSGVYWIDTNGTTTALFKGTAGSLTSGQYVITGGFLNVNIGRAPDATDTFEVAQINHAFLVNKSHIVINGLDIRFTENYGIGVNTLAAVDDVEVSDCDISWTTNDGCNVNSGTATNFRFLRNLVSDPQPDGSGAGDGFSVHLGSTYAVEGCTFRRCGKTGIGNSELSIGTIHNCLFDGATLSINGETAGGGSIAVRRCRFVNEAPFRVGSDNPMIYFLAGCHVETTAILENISLARGTGTTNLRGIRNGGVTITSAKNLALYGTGPGNTMDNGFLNFSPGTVSGESNNAVGGCTTNRNGWPSPGTNPVTVSADPYNNVAGNDLTPGAGSPLTAAGVAIEGVTTGSPPDIGYTGAT